MTSLTMADTCFATFYDLTGKSKANTYYLVIIVPCRYCQRFTLGMAKVNKVRCKADSRRHRVMPCVLSPCSRKAAKDCHLKKTHSKASEKKDWEGATCSVYLEHSHNAVLLLCSSYKL
ncbi:hypothetical protein Peur_013712 [Populus x canadensis]